MKRRIDLAVVAWVVALAILLGILNNLRVADECRVKWFGAPADLGDSEAETEEPS